MKHKAGNTQQIHELLYQALETEIGGLSVYETAVSCAINEDLKKEWKEYLEETRTHHRVLLTVFEQLGLDPDTQTPGREVVRHLGESLVKAMKMAVSAGDPDAAQLVATECVVLAETKDHANWSLIGVIADQHTGREAKILKQAYDAVATDEDHHLYHTQGWSRELWIESLGFPAVLPPPEEVKQVESAIGASRAEQARDKMLKH
ncbi:MAG: ferritin-like domain-containing protein [Achromobacter sp.]